MGAVLTNPLRVGLRQERVIPPQCLVIFGASGDLTHRKLIPALFELFRQRRLPSEFAVLGCARRPWSDDDFRGRMAEALKTEIADHQRAWETFSAGLFYEPVDLEDPQSVVRLGSRLEVIDRQRATRGNRTFYLSVSPNFYGSGCRSLAAAGLLLAATLAYELGCVALLLLIEAVAANALRTLAGGLPRPGLAEAWLLLRWLPLAQWVYGLATLRAALARRVEWRGVHYRVEGRGVRRLIP